MESPLLLLLLLLLAIISSVSSAGASVSYAAYCGSAVPEAAATTNSLAGSSSIIHLYNGYFSGGEPVFTRDADSNFSLPPTFFFHTRSLFLTNSPDVLHVSGTLTLRGGLHYPPIETNRTVSADPLSGLRHFRPHLPRGFGPRKQLSFDLDGFWSTSTGILCMVGTGRLRSAQASSFQALQKLVSTGPFMHITVSSRVATMSSHRKKPSLTVSILIQLALMLLKHNPSIETQILHYPIV